MKFVVYLLTPLAPSSDGIGDDFYRDRSSRVGHAPRWVGQPFLEIEAEKWDPRRRVRRQGRRGVLS